MTGIISYCFRDGDGKIIKRKNEHMSLLPASNMKIVSGYSAYRILGPLYTLRTKFYIDGDKLIVSGDPCPLLRYGDLTELGSNENLHDLKHVVFDNTVLDDAESGYGWEIDDADYCYQSKIVPYSMNEGCSDSRDRFRSLEDCGNPLHSTCRYSIPNQYENFAYFIGKFAHTENIDYKKDVVEGSEKAIVHGEKLIDVLRHIEIYSCNFSIEVLTKFLSYVKEQRRGNWEDSVQIIMKLISDMGINCDGIKIVDGSGLSRHNLLTTDFLSEFLYHIGKSGDFEFIHLLPSPGNGTISSRLSDMKDYEINAKTGSFSYCSSLSGYIGKMNVYFSIFLNNFILSDNEIAAQVDQVLRDFINGNL